VKIKVTDEFHNVWEFKVSTVEEVITVVGDWLKTMPRVTEDSPPIYEILIEI